MNANSIPAKQTNPDGSFLESQSVIAASDRKAARIYSTYDTEWLAFIAAKNHITKPSPPAPENRPRVWNHPTAAG